MDQRGGEMGIEKSASVPLARVFKLALGTALE